MALGEETVQWGRQGAAMPLFQQGVSTTDRGVFAGVSVASFLGATLCPLGSSVLCCCFRFHSWLPSGTAVSAAFTSELVFSSV